MRAKTYKVKIRLNGEHREQLEKLAEHFREINSRVFLTPESLIEGAVQQNEPMIVASLSEFAKLADEIEQERKEKEKKNAT